MTRAFAGLGSNLGDRVAHLETAVARLAEVPGLRVVRRSSLYETEPVGRAPAPAYVNAVVELETMLPPRETLDALLAVEIRAGRPRANRSGPRTLDLDLLFHGDRVLRTPRLVLPHPRLAFRPFVLVPLAEIAPLWVHPVLGCTMTALLAQAGRSAGVRLLEGAGAW